MFRRAKEGFVRLLGEDSAKAVEAALAVASQIPSDDEEIAEYMQLWEMAKVSLPDEAVTYDIANNLGVVLYEKGKYEEAKVFWLTALEGRRRILGEEHMNTLTSLMNMGIILKNMKDYEGALDYYQQALRMQEKVLGKTHPGTLMTIMNMGITYKDGFKDFVKAEEMYRLALDGYEKSLGTQHVDTKRCARNLAILLEEQERQDDLQKLLTAYPHIEEDYHWYSVEGDDDDEEDDDDDDDDDE